MAAGDRWGKHAVNDAGSTQILRGVEGIEWRGCGGLRRLGILKLKAVALSQGNFSFWQSIEGCDMCCMC